MVLIPDFSGTTFRSQEEIDQDQANIDAELAASEAASLQVAWNALNNVPSYIERFARGEGEE